MDEINQFLDGLIAQANAALAGMPPLEMVATAAELQWPIQRIREIAKSLNETLTTAKQKLADTVSKLKDKVATDTKATLLEKGEVIDKKAHDAALITAKTTGKEEAETAFNQKMDIQTKGAAARDAAVVAKTVLPVIANKIPLEVWADEPKRTHALAKVTFRLGKTTEARLSPETHAEIVASMVTLPFDETGDKTFDQQIAPALAVAKAAPPAAAGAAGAAATASAAAATAGTPNPAIQPPAAGVADPNDKDRWV